MRFQNQSGLPTILVVRKANLPQFEAELQRANIRHTARSRSALASTVAVCVDIDPIHISLLTQNLNFSIKTIDAEDINGNFDLIDKLLKAYFEEGRPKGGPI